MTRVDGGDEQAVCTTDAVTADSPVVVEVNGKDVAIVLSDGDYYAIANECPHQGGPLGDGKVEDDCLYCPWHGWQFDLESGEHVHGKATADTYDVTVEDGSIYVRAT
jgi:nitrite reductase (NADH) small subunit